MSRALLLAALSTATAALALPAHADTPVLDKIKASGAITVGHRESSIPFSYLDGSKPVGFGWDICMKIVDSVAKAVGRDSLKVQPQPVTSANRLPLVSNGTVDLECGSTTNNSERQKLVTFATNYFYTGTRLLVKADSPIRSVDDLKGKTVVSTTGTTNYRLMRGLGVEKKLDIDLLAAKDHAEGALMVQSGRAAAFAMDDILLYGLKASAVDPAALAVVGEPIQTEPYAIMLRRDDPAFKKVVDDALAGLVKSGEFEALYKKWFQSPIPPKGINLQVPMSAELRDNLRNLSDKPSL